MHLFVLNANYGPGFAREYALIRTNEPYITFIDTGDTFVTKEFPMIFSTLQNYPDFWLYSWAHNYGNNLEKLSNETHNRLHGRIYKRSFLQKFNIGFCLAATRANEDIGFNRLCRLCIRNTLLSDSN